MLFLFGDGPAPVICHSTRPANRIVGTLGACQPPLPGHQQVNEGALASHLLGLLPK